MSCNISSEPGIAGNLVDKLFLNARTVSLDLTVPQKWCGGSMAGGASD